LGGGFTWLLQVSVHIAKATWSQTRFDAFDADLIGARYENGFLLLPTLAPILIWLVLDRRLIQQVMIEGALSVGD